MHMYMYSTQVNLCEQKALHESQQESKARLHSEQRRSARRAGQWVAELALHDERVGPEQCSRREIEAVARFGQGQQSLERDPTQSRRARVAAEQQEPTRSVHFLISKINFDYLR